MTASGSMIETETVEGVAVIRLSDPDRRNALSIGMKTELLAALTAAVSTARAIVITGAGSAFCAGGDLRAMSEWTVDEAVESVQLSTRVYELIESAPTPVIAAINGHAMGGGLELVLACDFSVATRTALLGFPEVKVGLFPGAGGTSRLGGIVGAASARRLVLTGRPIDASRAFEIGLVTELADSPDDAVLRAVEMGRACAENSPGAMAAAKHAMRSTVGLSPDAAWAVELEIWRAVFDAPDRREGTRAFLEKRPARWTGSSAPELL